MDPFDLTGKTALVTGASRGIGEAVATGLAEKGAQVILSSRKADGLEKVAAAIREKGGQASVIPCHMGDIHAVTGMIRAVEDQFGSLDILVANAATNPHFGELTTAEEGIWDKIMDVNVKGPFFLMKAAAELMASQGGGSMITVSSVNGVQPALFQGVYSISKAAVIAMTKSYAKELAPKGIRVNALLPGLTNTKLAAALIADEAIQELALREIPMGRYAEPEEMVGAVLYLASDAASFTTGTTLVCDGGMLA